jgi:hypothetical protein
MAYTIDMGNNESISCGIFELHGRFTALLFSQRKTFKTYDGAVRWLAKFGRGPDGKSL